MALTLNRVFVYVVLILLALVCVIPFYIMLINSTRSSADINGGLSLVPGKYIDNNWISLYNKTSQDVKVGTKVIKMSIFRAFLNSATISVLVTFFVCYFSALTAYGFTIYNFKGKRVIFTIIVMAVMMVPQQLGLIGFYELCWKLKILNTYIPLTIPAIASAGGVFFLRQYMQQVINDSVIQAGRIDGATELGIFHRLIVPIVMPGIATQGIFAFVGSWNNYLLPLVILTSQHKKTLPMMIAEMRTSTWQTDYGVLYLAIAISVIPILVVFAIFSKRIMEGVAIGGSKE
jgi:multiple sugar transport system permease protein